MSWELLLLLVALMTLAACQGVSSGSKQQTTPSGSLSLSGSTIDFGSVTVGTSKMLTATATNSGTTAVTVTGAVSSASQFSVTQPALPVTLAVGKSVTLSVTFTPTASGSVTGNLSIASSASNSPVNVSLGTSDSPVNFSLSGNGVAGSPGTLTPTQSSLGFSSVQVGSSQTLTETLVNSGGSSVIVTGATTTGAGFSINGLSLPLTLGPDQSSPSFNIVFAPQSTGSFNGTLAITSDASNPTLNVALSGAGATSVPPPVITVSFQTPPPSTLQTNATASLTAIVTNDSTNAGVDWTVSCGSAGACGSFNPTHTASGGLTTYTVPYAPPSGNAVTITATSTADKAESVSDNIVITNTVSVIAIGVGFPIGSTVQAILPFVDGVTIFVNWAGQVAGTDTTTCTAAPCTQTSDFTAYDRAIATYVSSTCGASLRGKGSPCIVNLTFPPVTALMSYNSNTPTWVFSQAWADTVGSPVQDAAFCSYYPQNMSANPLPPASAIANINTTNCGSAGTTQCTEATVATGLPAIWEKPYVTAINNWHQAIIQHYAGVTYPAYLRLGVSIGSEAAVTCSTINGVAGTGLESLTSPADADGLKAAWTGAAVNQIAFNASQRAALNPAPTWQLMNTVNMGQRLEAVNGDGGIDPSWAVIEADAVLANQPYAIGTEGLANGMIGSDVTDIANITCKGPDCCSDDWCNVHTMVEGKVPAVELQTCNLSNPAGGTANCLDCILAGTCTDDSQTLSQVLALSAEHGTTVQELYLGEFQCAFDQANYVSVAPSCTPAVSAAYAAAIQALATGQ